MDRALCRCGTTAGPYHLSCPSLLTASHLQLLHQPLQRQALHQVSLLTVARVGCMLKAAML